MNWIWRFSSQEGPSPSRRDIQDAAEPMRQELIDLFFSLAEQNLGAITPERVYRVIGQSLGIGVAGQSDSGFRYASGRDISGVDWVRVYDLIERLWQDFTRAELSETFREGVNQILAAHGAAWDLGEDGRLHRVLPAEANERVSNAFGELRAPRYSAALELFNHGAEAHNDRPRRDRDACANVFDAMESVAKEKYGMPTASFGQVVNHLRATAGMNDHTISILDSLNRSRNGTFGHGMISPFNLNPAEVDFIYLACVGAILLFVRSPNPGDFRDWA